MRLFAALLLLPALGHAGGPRPGPLPAAAARVQAALPGLSPSSLLAPVPGDLGRLAPLPALDWGTPRSREGRPLPAALDPRRAAVLLQRAGPADALPQAPADPAGLLERVNSVLQDLSPGRLASMPEEDLSAVSSLLDGAGPADRETALRAAAVLSQARTQAILDRRGRPLEVFEPYKRVKDMQTLPAYIRGTPDGVRLVPPAERTVYRHYSSLDGTRAIRDSGLLRNGILEYIELIQHVSMKYYEDLTGAFLTLPGTPASRVGVRDENKGWVDLRVPDALPLLKASSSHDIWFIPLPRRSAAWAAAGYRGWLAGEEVPSHELDMIRRLDERGGPGPELDAPVEIAGSSED